MPVLQPEMMHLLWLIALAHVVGDFVLQTDRVFRLKVTSAWGVLLHVGICGITMVAVLLPFVPDARIWTVIAGVTAWHLLLDWSKGVLRKRWGKETIGLFLGDQALHIVGIIGAVLVCCRFAGPPTPADSLRWLLIPLPAVIVTTAVLVASFAAAPLIYYLQQLPGGRRREDPAPFPAYLVRVPGYVERALGTVGAYVGEWGMIALVAIVGRWVWRRGLHDSAATVEALAGIVFCLVMGVGARLLVGR
ncbi:MAG: DUF3307 domain-containing protein [candidate division KSB1 bacterium]|nr:DUF3307 domain-containing protein [candidate division KSB1 bacterium]MDZ7384985.1 DUF3307 domain-containing protein [candidate division KSB1 bacterium]MDZ7391531.1 DUF3307 domain-containing protein [candidate division KSB1 bacterium]MDZ7412275.1 DUF3307 domain-containing protein [candidate division KSB1 bacterium]